MRDLNIIIKNFIHTMQSNEDLYQNAIKKHGINEVKEKFGKKDRIGHGASGIVYKTLLNENIVAIKEINIPSDENQAMKTFINELKIHGRADNGRIIQFYGINRNVEENLYYFVLEYANQGNLREYLKGKNFNKGNLKWEERKCLATQIAEGVLYLHNELNIAHRDLHTKNILINDGNVKITDFGLSKNLDSAMTSGSNIFGIVSFIDPKKLINSKNFLLDKRSDIYSLGTVLWEISGCRAPFSDEDPRTLYSKICQGLREKPVKGTPIEYIKIYTDCWLLEPDFRPLINQVLSRLQSASLEPIFEEVSTNYLQLPETRNFNFGYSDLTLPCSSRNITNSMVIPTTCKNCNLQFTNNWCHKCESQTFQENFPKWTSGNTKLDEIIRNSQLNSTKYNKYFEWINFDRFENIKGSYCELYTAIWLDGIRELWDDKSQQLVRTKPVQIILREIRFNSTIKNLELYLELESSIRCYGFTKNPKTGCYYMVLKHASNGNLRQYIRRKFPTRWSERLSILQKIVESVHNIHKENYIHRDLYPGNILIHEDDWTHKHKLKIYINDLDLCANLNFKIEQQQYGNLLYIAPEVIGGKKDKKDFSIKSDIYSLGIIMWEFASGDEPYSDYESDDEDELILDIVHGVRPNYVIGTPKCYYELMQKCLDADPEKRPTTLDLLQELKSFDKINKHQFEAADDRIRGQPLGTRPNQLSKNNSEISVKSIDITEIYSGKTGFRFTNKPLQFYYNLPETS